MKKTISAYTYEQAQEAMTALAHCENSLKKLEAEQDMQVAKVRDKHADRIGELKSEIAGCKEVLTTYANEHKEEWPGKKLELTNGTLKFTASTGKVVLPEGATEEDLTALLIKKHPDFVSTRTCIAKQAVLDFADSPEGKKVLKLTGITVEKGDKLTIKPKTEKLLPV